jgi:hypothetical protein
MGIFQQTNFRSFAPIKSIGAQDDSIVIFFPTMVIFERAQRAGSA